MPAPAAPRADATRILREIKLLRLLRHPDIVEIKHIMLPPSARDFKDIYVVFELMETDLHQVGTLASPGRAPQFPAALPTELRVQQMLHNPPMLRDMFDV